MTDCHAVTCRWKMNASCTKICDRVLFYCLCSLVHRGNLQHVWATRKDHSVLHVRVWKIKHKLPSDNIPKWERIFTGEKIKTFKLLDRQLFAPKFKNTNTAKTKKQKKETPIFPFHSLQPEKQKRKLMTMLSTFNCCCLPRPSCIRMAAFTRPMH